MEKGFVENYFNVPIVLFSLCGYQREIRILTNEDIFCVNWQL